MTTGMTTMIRCAIDAREYTHPNRLTGVGRFLTNIVLPLGAKASEFEFRLLVRSPEAVPEKLHKLPGVVIETLPHNRPPAYLEQVYMPHRAKEMKADCFFSPWHKGAILPVSMPLIITVHDLAGLRLPDMAAWRKMIATWRLRNTIRRCRKVIVVSKFTERDLVNLIPQAAEKTVVMYSDIGAEWFATLRDRCSTMPPPISPVLHGKFFLYVGTFKPHKNVDVLIRGFAAGVRDGRLRAHNLVLVGGDDANLGRINGLISRLGMEPRVRIVRDIDDYSLSRFYHAADWFVTASQYEGYGYPPVEAMIGECPVICHQATGLIEVVGSAALSLPVVSDVEIAASLTRAAGMNSQQRQEYVEAGSRQCRLFNPGQTAETFARLLRSLVTPSMSFPGSATTPGKKTAMYLGGA